jgi:hypothetical protein
MSDLEKSPESTSIDPLRDRAIAILKKRRDFRAHLLVYILFNSALIASWAMLSPHTFFWPVFPIAFWGIGVVMNGWEVYASGDFSEERVEREMYRLAGRR